MKTWIKRTFLCLLLVVGGVGLLYTYRDSLLLTLTSIQLQKHAGRLFGTPMGYAEKRVEGGMLVVEAPRFGETFAADRLIVEPRWLPGLRGVQVKTRLWGPELSNLPLAKFSGKRFWLAKAFRVKWECEVEGGTLMGEPFSGRAWGEDSRKIGLDFALGGGRLELGYGARLREKELRFGLEGISAQALGPLCLSQGWKAEGGVLRGKGTLHFPNRGLPWLEGKGEARDLIIRGNRLFEIGEIRFELTPAVPRRELGRVNDWEGLATAMRGEIGLVVGTLAVKAEFGGGEARLGVKGSDLEVTGRVAGGVREGIVEWARGGSCELWSEGEKVKAMLKDLGPEQTGFLKALTHPFTAALEKVDHVGGILSATVSGVVVERELRQLWIGELVAGDLELRVGEAEVGARELVGHLAFPDLKRGWERECSARLMVEGGYRRGEFCVDEVGGELLFDSGTVERLEAKGKIGGLVVEASAHPLPHARAVKVRVLGNVNEVVALWPNEVLGKYFKGDEFVLEVELERSHASIAGTGQWEVGGDVLPFGFTLAPQRKGPTPLPLVVERMLNPMMPAPKSRFPLELGPAKVLAFGGGWIGADRVEAAKFIQPLLRGHEGLSLFGTVDLQARFDGQELALDYEGYNMRLEAPLFRITIPHTGDLGATAPDSARAHHSFNLREGSQKGHVPMQHATYIEKHSGLIFSHIGGAVELHSKGLVVPEMVGRCEGVEFIGSVDMIRYAGVPTDLKLIAREARGPLAGAQNILNHLSRSPVWEIETQGVAYLEGGGLDLRILFLPGKAQVEASVQGGIANGRWASGHGMELEGLATRFTYLHKGKHLAFEEVSGLMRFEGGESYPLVAPALVFDDFPKGSCHFTTGVTGLAEVRGELVAVGEGKRLNLKSAYFGGIKPHVRHCLLGERIRLLPEIQVESLARDICLLEQITGWPLGTSLVKGLGGRGVLKGEVIWDKHRDLWRGELSSKTLVCHGHPFKSAHLVVEGDSQGWRVVAEADRLLAKAKLKGKEVIEGEVAYGPEVKTHFAGNLGDDGLLGEFVRCRLPANAAAHLPYLRNLPFLSEATGAIGLTGPFSVGAQGVTANLALHLDRVGLAGMVLDQTTPLGCRVAEGAVSIEGFHLRPSPDGGLGVDLEVGKLSLELDGGALAVSEMAFELPQNLLPWAAERATLLFGVSLPLEQIGERVSCEGGFRGRLGYSSEGLELTLADGEYGISGNKWPLRDTRLNSTEEGMRAASRVAYKGYDYQVEFARQKGHPELGCLTIASPDDQGPEVLTLFWKFDPAPTLTHLEGSLRGIGAKLRTDLEASNEKVLTLFGSVEVDALKALPLLPDRVTGVVEKAKLGAGYQLNGRFEVPLGDMGNLTFTGDLSGRQCEVAGFCLERLSANLFLSPNHLSIHSFSLTDRTGRWSIDRVEGVKDREGEWRFEAPLVRVTNFQPTILKGTYKPYGKNKPLTITTGEIHYLSGGADPTTWSGYGSFTFRHPPKKEVAGTPFALPDDLLGILGLDFQSLIPAAGRVNFTIGQGRCTVTSFADVHSRGRRSQFFLADEESSYVDFDGNISLRVRTKQHNLILKITELFTVAIGGTLDKPTFRLQHPTKSAS